MNACLIQIESLWTQGKDHPSSDIFLFFYSRVDIGLEVVRRQDHQAGLLEEVDVPNVKGEVYLLLAGQTLQDSGKTGCF